MSDHNFNLQINFQKAYESKDESNVAYIEGIASGPEVDLLNERMSPQALQSMVKSLHRGVIEFRDVHNREWNAELGEVVELHLTDDNHLFYRAKLDLNISTARDLVYRITKQGKKLGVSVGGKIKKAGYEYVAELGKSIYTYFDVEINHIGITRQAVYHHSFADVVLKSLSAQPKGHDMQEERTDAEVEKTDAEEAETQTEETSQEETQDEAVAAEEQSDATQTEGQEVETEEATEDAAADADAEAEVTEEETEEVAETSEEAADAAETEETATDDPEVTKALTEAQAEAETLKKSLSDATTKVDQLTKSLTAKTQEAEAAQQELAEVKKSLAEKETELEKVSTRKTLIVDKFGGGEVEKAQTLDEEMAEKSKEFNRDFAKKFIGAY